MVADPPRLSVVAPGNKPSSGGGCNPLDGLLPPGEWTKLAAASGRPRIVSEAGEPGPDISLSHSGGWCAAAVAPDGRVGIDVEAVGRQRDWRAMACAYLSPGECRAVEREGEDAFLAFWTLREAVAKLGEDGLSGALALDGTLILPGHNGLCTHGGWIAAHRRLDGAHLAVAWAPERLSAEMLRAFAATLDCVCIQSSL